MSSLSIKEFRKTEQFQFQCTGTWLAWPFFPSFPPSISGMLAIRERKAHSYLWSPLEELRHRNTKEFLPRKMMRKKTSEKLFYTFDY